MAPKKSKIQLPKGPRSLIPTPQPQRLIKVDQEPIDYGREKVAFNFHQICPDQSPGFKEWQALDHLVDALEVMKACNSMTVNEATSGKPPRLNIYGGYPSNSEFERPSYISEDAQWGTLRVSGKVRVAGHIVRNVFYVVFLDERHRFAPAPKKHT